MNHDVAQQALDRQEIIETVNKIGLMADLRNWAECRASFSDQVEFDYTSMLGGQPTTVSADTQIQQWKDFFASTFKTTQHLIGSHTLTLKGDTATCISHFQAHHVFLDTSEGKTWTLGGTYHHELSRTSDTPTPTVAVRCRLLPENIRSRNSFVVLQSVSHYRSLQSGTCPSRLE